jgi:hypothetical protein
MVVVPHADTRSTGRSFVRSSSEVMAQSGIDKISPGPKLDALTAEKVFGWRKVHKHQGSLVGRKQDKAGRWRLAKVPGYSTNVGHAHAIEDQMKRLGRFDQYWSELQRYARSTKHSIILGNSGATLSGRDQSGGAIRPSHSVESRSQTDSKIESASLSHSGFVQSSPAAPRPSCSHG